jgi:hypothetical protein
MDQLSALALAISVSVIVSTIVTVVMTEPLRIVLKQLCLDNNATAFWIPFTTVMCWSLAIKSLGRGRRPNRGFWMARPDSKARISSSMAFA